MNDIYYIALSYYQQQQYERALEILNRKKTLNQSVQCRYVAALCSVSMRNHGVIGKHCWLIEYVACLGKRLGCIGLLGP